MTVSTITSHPSFFQLAYDVLGGEGDKTKAEVRMTDRIMSAIEEKAHPGERWPIPYAPYSTAELAAIARQFTHPIDPAATVSIELSKEQIDHLSARLSTYLENPKAATGQKRGLLRLLDALKPA